MVTRFDWLLILIMRLVSGTIKAYSYPGECDPVFYDFPYCLDFLTGEDPEPKQSCCENIGNLNELAKHQLGAKMVCWCIEVMVEGQKPGLQASRIEELPVKCQTHLSFPISEAMDCARVPD